jgi:alpha-tubulin suppressor-like RCC1 family protein
MGIRSGYPGPVGVVALPGMRGRVALSAAMAAAMVLVGSAPPTAASVAHVKAAYFWGHNLCQLGEWAPPPPFVYALPSPVTVADWAVDVAQASAGAGFNVLLRTEGTVWAWGINDWGQVGDGTGGGGTLHVRCDPRRVLGLPPGIVQVSAGLTHSLAVASDGSVWAWGTNHHGELGTPGVFPLVAVRVPGISGVRQVSAGAEFSVALRTNGEVWTWGRGDQGQLGDGTHVTSRPTPARAPMGYGMVQVSAGYAHALALRPGSLWAWGSNSSGQLGNGTTVADSATPVRVDRRTDRVTQIDAGYSHNLALDADGSIWAWGQNTDGQLGIGVVDDWNAPDRNIPGRVATTGVTQVSAGGANSLAVLADGGLLMWGSDWYGTLGDGTRTSQPTPVPTRVPGMAGVAQAAVGGHQTVAVADGVVVPRVVGDHKLVAVPRLQAAGLVVHIEEIPDDQYCDDVDYVLSQGPSGGSVVRPGALVILGVAVQPPQGCH